MCRSLRLHHRHEQIGDASASTLRAAPRAPCSNRPGPGCSTRRYFFAASIVRAKGSIQSGLASVPSRSRVRDCSPPPDEVQVRVTRRDRAPCDLSMQDLADNLHALRRRSSEASGPTPRRRHDLKQRDGSVGPESRVRLVRGEGLISPSSDTRIVPSAAVKRTTNGSFHSMLGAAKTQDYSSRRRE